jgi:hypothetical protein
MAIEAAGTEQAWQDAIALVRPRATVLLFGGLEAGTLVPVDATRVHYDELTLRGAFHHTPRHVRAALAFLASGAYPWEELVTHRVGLDGLPALFRDPPRDLLKAAVLPLRSLERGDPREGRPSAPFPRIRHRPGIGAVARATASRGPRQAAPATGDREAAEDDSDERERGGRADAGGDPVEARAARDCDGDDERRPGAVGGPVAGDRRHGLDAGDLARPVARDDGRRRRLRRPLGEPRVSTRRRRERAHDGEGHDAGAKQVHGLPPLGGRLVRPVGCTVGETGHPRPTRVPACGNTAL